MTRQDALRRLKLDPMATRSEIETAYHKFVRRYPPEFHPDRFREFDEAFRFLISFPVMVERLLSADTQEDLHDGESFPLPLSLPVPSKDGALREIKAKFKIVHLWSGIDTKKT
jgi:hypothetical protein